MAYFNSDSFFQVVETNDRSIAKKLSLNCQLDEDSLDLFKQFCLERATYCTICFKICLNVTFCFKFVLKPGFSVILTSLHWMAFSILSMALEIMSCFVLGTTFSTFTEEQNVPLTPTGS